MITRRARRRWPWLFGLLLFIGLGLFLVRRSGAKTPPVDAALVVTAKRGLLAIEIIETGRVVPREKIDLKSKLAGEVVEVRVDEGARVTKGQLLLVLDPTDYQRDVARAETDVAQAKNALELARINLDRKQAGVRESVMPALELDAARHDLTAKTVAVRASQVALGAALDRVRYTKIFSPIDGTVIQRNIQPGEVVTPGIVSTFDGKALLTVADLSGMVVKVDLNQIDVAKVRAGQSATLTLDALPGKTYEASLTKIAPASVKPPGKDLEVFPVEAQLTQVDGLIKPGMTADVRIHLDAKPNVLFLSLEAIRKENGKSFVTRVKSDPKSGQQTEKIEVTLGARSDREVEITSGIEENDQILINPASASENETKM